MCTWKMKEEASDQIEGHGLPTEANTAHGIFELLRRNGIPAVLLESGSSGWTFIGIVNPSVVVPEGEASFEFMREFLRKKLREKSDDSQKSLKFDDLPFWSVPQKAPDIPPFTRGFVGFMSYDLGAEWLGVKQRVERNVACPKTCFVYVDRVFAFRANRKFYAVQSGRERARKTPAFKSNLTQKEYFKKINKIKNYLYSGETYQVNFSQRFTMPFKGDAFELYKKITKINPSPFQFFMEGRTVNANAKDFAVISNSPERLFRIYRDAKTNSRILETRPIKGTSPAGRTPQEEKKAVTRLLASEKERAELAMIIDLERNDIGKLCIPGTVEVSENRTIEKYSHVIHTVANIRGVLPEQYDWLDALKALHPGGSVTGCPKKRTVEIIDRLEDYSRGVYCGTAGYIDVSGNCDFNIMIRTLWFEKDGKAGKLIFHSGGGIVVDSDPEKEYAETFHKAEALMSAIYEVGSNFGIQTQRLHLH